MPRPTALVTEAQLSVLESLWASGPASVREIAKSVYGQNTPAFHATVNSLLDQLEEKGYVRRNRGGFAHVFAAKIDRPAVVAAQLQQIADSHFDGALSPMLLALVEKLSLKPRDLKAIRKIIDQID